MGPEFKRILVPVDFSDYSKNALKYAVSFADHFNAGIYLIYVVEPIIYPADFSMGQVSLPTIDSQINIKAKEELENLAVKEIPSTVHWETIVKTGKPFIEIIETVKEIEADLIIIATHGHTGVETILFGSTAEKVVKRATCPVLTLRGHGHRKQNTPVK